MNFSFKQLNAEFFRRNKNDIIFITAGVVLLVGILVVFISSISFLSTSVDTAIDNQAVSNTQTKFNIDSLQNLGIIEGASSTTSTSSSQ